VGTGELVGSGAVVVGASLVTGAEVGSGAEVDGGVDAVVCCPVVGTGVSEGFGGGASTGTAVPSGRAAPGVPVDVG
jgi:hypothetical protein